MEKKTRKEKKTKVVFVLLGAVILVVATVFVVVAVMNGKEANETTGTEQGNYELLNRGFVTNKNADDMVEDMQEKVAEGMFECMMTTEWLFTKGGAKAHNVYVANSPNNTHTIYFDVYLEDEIVYSSPLIPVGQADEGFSLNKTLDAGKYSMRVQYHLVDEKYEEISDVGFMVTVTIKD